MQGSGIGHGIAALWPTYGGAMANGGAVWAWEWRRSYLPTLAPCNALRKVAAWIGHA